MMIYKVGGAVRDSLLGVPFTETDWVVVGARPEALLQQGFRQVGKDFPVFLHPQTQEEYALARTERKTGHGYYGFSVHAEPSVTLEEDLARRDLTINAMAQAEDGTLIDPYGGQQDLAARLLRHVAPAFVEDPLRVLRVARFAARYHQMGFTVAPETQALMAEIVAQGELSHLATERIWTETERALAGPNPAVYFATLKSCGALQQLLPAVSVTSGIDRLQQAGSLADSPHCRWAILLSELSPHRSAQTSQHIKAPNSFTLLAERLCHWRPQVKAALGDAEACMTLIEGLDALRREEPFAGFITCCAALEATIAASHEGCQLLRSAVAAGAAVTARQLADTGLQGPQLGAAIRAARVDAIDAVLRSA